MAHVDATTLSLLALGEDIEADYGHVLDCPRCHSELTSLRRTVRVAEQGDLTDEDILGLPPCEPPAHVWSRIQDEMLAPCGEPQRRRIVCPNWSVAASVALGLVLGGGIVHMAAGGPSTTVSPQVEQMSRVIATATMTSAEKKGAAQATAEVISDGRSARVEVQASALPRRSGDRYLVALRETDGQRIRLGEITASQMSFDVPGTAALTYGLRVEILAAPAGRPDANARPVLSGVVTPVAGDSGSPAGPEALATATAETLAAQTFPGAGPAASAFSAGSAAASSLSRGPSPTSVSTPVGPATKPNVVPTTSTDAGQALLPGSPGSLPAAAPDPGLPPVTSPVPGSSSSSSTTPEAPAGQSGAGASASGAASSPTPDGSSSTAESSSAAGSSTAGSSSAAESPADTGNSAAAPGGTNSGGKAASTTSTSPELRSPLALAGGSVSGTPDTPATTGGSPSRNESTKSPGKSSSTSPVTKRKKRKKRVRKALPLPGAPPVTRQLTTAPAAAPSPRAVPTPSPAATPSPSSLASRVQSEGAAP